MSEQEALQNPHADVERRDLIQDLIRVRQLEQAFRSPKPTPAETILLGGAGVTGRQYGPFFAQAGLPICEVIDISPKADVKALEVLSGAEYRQLSSPFDIQTIEEAVKRHPRAAIYVMTPQDTHTQWLSNLAPLIIDQRIPLAMEKPLAMDEHEAQQIISLINQYPDLAHLVTAGSYTTFKAAALLSLFGVIDKNSPVLKLIKPLDDKTPDFQETYLNYSYKLGQLTNVRCLFMEGSKDIREVIGSYGRTHLALYPGGGMTGDLLEHPLDPLIRLGIIDPESKFSRVYLGYTPIGKAAVSFPWQVPDKEGLAEIEGELTLYGKDNAPVLVTYGKRGPEFIGNVRRSKLTFSDGTIMEIQYVTAANADGRSNIFTIQRPDSPLHTYYLDQHPYPYISMLEQYKGLWSGNLQGEGGLYSQLVNAFMIGDIYRIWKGEEPSLFLKSEKFRKQKNTESSKYQDRQDRDFKSIKKMS